MINRQDLYAIGVPFNVLPPGPREAGWVIWEHQADLTTVEYYLDPWPRSGKLDKITKQEAERLSREADMLQDTPPVPQHVYESMANQQEIHGFA